MGGSDATLDSRDLWPTQERESMHEALSRWAETLDRVFARTESVSGECLPVTAAAYVSKGH